MKVSQYLTSNVVRLFNGEPYASSKLCHFRDLTNGLQDRYKFLQVPTKIEEFDIQQGLEFLHGAFNEETIISRLKIYNDGFFCEALQPTEVIQKVIDDVSNWIRHDFKMTIDDADPPNQFFVSSLEVESDASSVLGLSKFSTIGEKITALLASYGIAVPAFEPVFLGLHCDQTQEANAQPTKFTFERRVNQSFNSKLFFSSAPLKTADHLEVLNELGGLLAN